MAKTISGSAADMTFADQSYGTTSSAKTRDFTFSNEETGKSITISNNTNPTEFPATIVKSGDCTGTVTISVKFKPSAQGERSGSITVSGDCGSKTFTVKGNGVRANSALSMNNGSVNVSIAGINSSTLDLSTLIAEQTGNGEVTFQVISATGARATTSTATIDATDKKTFSATETGVYTIRATKALTDQYNSTTDDFTVTVNKLQPTIVFTKLDHIYSGNTLSNMARVLYNGVDVPLNQVDFDYSFDNPSWFSLNPSNAKQIMVSTDYSTEQDEKLCVTTKATYYYNSVTADTTYHLEVKRTPEFYLNGVLLDKNDTTNLNLEVDETATFTFDKITSGFQFPTTPSHFTYNNETGVLTATVAGDEPFFFNEPGNGITFQHQCNLHLYVRKHETELTALVNNNAVWMVDDSIAESSIYTLTKGDANVPVVVSSSNTNVIAKEDGKWVAKGEGSAVLTIAQVNSNKWSGDTITRTIYVNKYDPEFDWNLPATVNYNMAFAHPVTSTNEMEECTFSYSSNNTSVINWTNGALRTFEKAGTHVGITVTQAGNYKWNSKSQIFYVDVAKLPDHVEINMNTQAVRDAVYSGKANKGSISCSTSGKITLNQNGGIAVWTANPLYYDIHFTGVPKNVTFTYSQSMASSTAIGATGKSFIVYESSNGSNWSEVWTSDGALGNTSTHSTTQTLDPSTKYLRFFFDGTYAGYYENIVVRERTEIRSGKDKLDFGSENAGSNASNQNVNISWYNVNPLTLSIEGGDGKYSVSPTTIESSKDSYAVGVPVTVSYKHDAGGTHNANLVISDGVVSKQIPLTGTTNKVTPEITWKENLSPMSRGENVTDPAEAIVELVYTSSDSTVVDVEGNVLKPLKKGNATITASYDGSESLVYNSNSSTIDVLVTNLAVQHIHWTQPFTRLKWSDDEELSEKNTPDFDLDATVSYYDPETEQEVEITDRGVSYTSGDPAVIQVLEGNKLHVVGQGTTTLTAYIAGITDSLYEATVIRDVIVREPTLDCEKWVLENKSASMATEINSFSGVETVYALSGEPGYLSFEAWREAIHVIKDWTDGNLFVAEKIGNDWHELTGEDGLALDLNYANRKAFDSIPMSREATQVKIYKKTGSTGIHAFSGAYVTLARYLELENTKNKKTHTIDLSTTEAKPGVAVEKTFTVNYSNITDQLDVELKHGDKFSIVSGDTIGNECGDKGKATVRVRFLSNDVDLYKDTLLVHNLTDTVYVYLSADVDKHQQQITWEPATTNLNTTDNVTFGATTTGSAANLSVTYAVTAGDAATVDAETGVLTIVKDGDVTIEARCEGNNKYYDAEPVPYTFHIEKVTPTITKNPKASDVTLPATLASSTWTENGVASVDGTFAWTSPSTALVAGDIAYEVTFTPKNTNWYTTATCMVAPHVLRATQTIDWSFDATEIYGNANYTFDAAASSGLTVTYSSSNNEVASVNDQNKLVLHKAGESVTITATQAGNETYLPVSESRTFTVLYWTPEIVENPVGGTMYVGHVLSDASLTGGVAIVNGDTIQGSFVWEDANTATINQPGPATHNAIFVPQNANFFAEVVCEDIPLEVLRYLPRIQTNTLSADGIEFPATLESSNLHGSVTMMDYDRIPNVEVTGHVEWKTPTTILRPGTQNGIALFVPDNSAWYEAVEIPVSVKVTGGYVFNGDNNDSTWTQQANWAGNLIPGAEDPVLVNDYVEIKTSVTVGSLTIAENVDLVVKDGGVLRIGNDDSESRDRYGNLRVENGGQVIFGEGEVQVNDFVLEAKLGDNNNLGNSGQVHNPATLNVNGNAYFDLALDPSGECSPGWYTFTVPFPVDALNGVTRFRNSDGKEITIKNEVNYAIMDFSESRRVETGYGWKKFRGIMQPGQCYTMTIDDVDNVYRFKMTNNGAFNNQMNEALQYSTVESDVRGWNALGNGTLAYVDLSATNIEHVQVYNHENNSYIPVDIDEYTYVVGSTYMVQAPVANSKIVYEQNGASHTLRAPQRYESTSNSEFMLTLTGQNADRPEDRLYVSASEDAVDEYTRGRELTKFASPTDSKVAQVWANAYGMKLCDIEMPLVNNNASTPISIYAPQNGVYTLAVERSPENAILFLTKNGRVMWNLSQSGYLLDLTKGTTDSYGLCLVYSAPQVATGMDEVVNGVKGQKVIINHQIYIITSAGDIYDATGKRVN